MAHLNIDARRAMVGKVLNAGIRIGSREAKLLGVIFNCLVSAIQADVKAIRTKPEKDARLAAVSGLLFDKQRSQRDG